MHPASSRPGPKRPREGGGLVPADKVAAWVDRYWEEVALPVLIRYGTIPCLSPSFDASWSAHGDIDRAAELLAAFARSRPLLGIEAEIVRLPGRTPVLLVDIPATNRARSGATTLIYGHLDKQPPLGAWRNGLDPYGPTRQADRLYGRGMADDGYATFAALGALEALQATGTAHGRCVVLIEASEESGSPDLGTYIDHLAGRIADPSLVVCLDSGGPTYDRLWMTTSLRGNLSGTLRVEVLEEGVHSGTAGGIVPSSFRILRHLLSRIEDETTGEILLAELRADIPPQRRREIETVAEELGALALGRFPTVPGLGICGQSVAEGIELSTWHPSLSVIGVDGLPCLAEAGNVLRPSTAVKISLRLPPTCDVEIALEVVGQALLRDPPHGARVTFHPEPPAQGWNAPSPSPWLADAIASASVAFFGAPASALGLGGSIPFLALLGDRYPTAQLLATGVLGPESNAHGPNEFLHVPSAKALTACVADILARAPSA